MTALSKIQPVRNLKPYFKIAEDEAKKSPCSRRQYGCVIAWQTGDLDGYVAACNSRESRCCDEVCARTRFDTAHGGRVEIGAEAHAETCALIRYKGDLNAVVILVGRIGDKELLGSDVYSCHTCCLNLKFAGFKHIYIKDDDGTIIPVSVEKMIERREKEWENTGASI